MRRDVAGLRNGPTAQAVSAPADWGYPGLNTAEGQNALMILTTSEANTAVVFLRSLPVPSPVLTPVSEREHFFNSGDRHIAIGAGALLTTPLALTTWLVEC